MQTNLKNGSFANMQGLSNEKKSFILCSCAADSIFFIFSTQAVSSYIQFDKTTTPLPKQKPLTTTQQF